MTIDEAIDNLKSAKEQGKKNIILAWWDSSMFDRKDDKDWEVDASRVEDEMDWSSTHDDISDILKNI